jgi:hypothetical protein
MLVVADVAAGCAKSSKGPRRRGGTTWLTIVRAASTSSSSAQATALPSTPLGRQRLNRIRHERPQETTRGGDRRINSRPPRTSAAAKFQDITHATQPTDACTGFVIGVSSRLMESDGLTLRLEVGLDPDADASELDERTRQLREELLGLDVYEVSRPRGEAPPAGTRAAEAVLLGTLVVTGGREVVSAIVRTLIGWVSRGRSRSVKLQLDGDVLELSQASADEQRRAAEAFFARHGIPET